MPNTPADKPGELTRRVLTQHNPDGSYTAQSVTSSPEFKIRAECLIPSRLVVPVIFVPGIMGTRLKVARREGQSAWFPPEGTWEGLKQVLQNLLRDAAARQRLLDPTATEVDDNGVARPDPEIAKLLGDAPGETDDERGKWRGWGQVHAASYGEILGVLERRLADMLVNGENKQPQWQAAVMAWQDKDKLGAQKPFTMLDDDALKRAASVFYPVHAVGYNWLKSNKDSAQRLAEEIQRILDHYTGCKKVAEKVILVTHSMGGLVARACSQLPGMQDKIMGIMHGVMPAIGAPATYKRMRAGWEGVEQVILGRDAAENTAVMANAPGPLELLPTRQYRSQATDGSNGGSRHWLRVSCPVKDHDRHAERVYTELGDAADPYTSIYLNNTEQNWWRLVKEELVDPAGREEREKAQREGKKGVGENGGQSDFKRYVKVMERAKELHDFIEDKYHPNTYAHYAADAKKLAWNEVHWQGAASVGGDVSKALMAEDNLNGTVMLRFREAAHAFEIDRGRGPGDGTVPAESGAAPTPHVVQIFRHEGAAKGHTSYDHQGSYKANIVQAATLYSICRMVADSDWLKANLHKA